MYLDVKQWVETCEVCQKRDGKRWDEPLKPTWVSGLWEKVGVDVVHMPLGKGGKRYLVLARDDLSGWIEGRALTSNSSQAVAKFIFEEIIVRHGCPKRIVNDGGGENKGEVIQLLEKMGVTQIVVSAYHPQGNGMVERGHKPITDSIAKVCSERQSDWPEYLPYALWADRITARRSTGMSPFS
jgi:transposase InsO family protein